MVYFSNLEIIRFIYIHVPFSFTQKDARGNNQKTITFLIYIRLLNQIYQVIVKSRFYMFFFLSLDKCMLLELLEFLIMFRKLYQVTYCLATPELIENH